MDYRKLVKAAAVLLVGIFMGRPIIDAVDSAVDVYRSGVSAPVATQTVPKEAG